MHKGQKVPVKAWIEGVDCEPDALQQITEIASMPFIKGVAVMPDCHVGKGCTVGSVIATRGAIIPAAVGVDLGCGMSALKTTLRATDLPDDLSKLRSRIELYVPHGRTDQGGRNDKGAWSDIPDSIRAKWGVLDEGFKDLIIEHPHLEHPRAMGQLGTLGTGNHFIEVCLDADQTVWLMLHSGSRGVGARIGDYFIGLAKKEMERYFIELPNKDLAYLVEGSRKFDDYLKATQWANGYAYANREAMMQNVKRAVLEEVGGFTESPIIYDSVVYSGFVTCHHNYLSMERHFGQNVLVTRKGAVSAKKGQLGIIPGSMGARSFIVCGKGSWESLHSCSHGAGRRMSRTAARKNLTELQMHLMNEVEYNKEYDLLDEMPGAYKPIESVMNAQTDLVDIVATLKQVLVVKG